MPRGDVRTLQGRGTRGVATRHYPDGVTRALAEDPERWFTAPQQRFPSKAKRSSVVGFEIEGYRLVGKRYHARSRWVALRRLLGRSPACRAWRNARRLERAGLRTPMVVLCLDRRFGPFHDGSYLFTEWVDARPSDDYLADPEIPYRDKALVLGRMIRAMGQLHEAGLAHRDLKARNMLVDREGQIIFIDLDDVRHAWLPRLRRRDARADRERLSASLPAVAGEGGPADRRVAGADHE